MLIDLQNFHNRDREPDEEELSDLSENVPQINGPAKYEDIFSVDVASDIQKVDEENNLYAANLERWTFRMN
jgi:hypothetical protein